MLWHEPSRPLDRGGDDRVSLNGVPGPYRTLGGRGTLSGSPLQSEERFVEEKNIWDGLCVFLSSQKEVLLSSLSIW